MSSSHDYGGVDISLAAGPTDIRGSRCRSTFELAYI